MHNSYGEDSHSTSSAINNKRKRFLPRISLRRFLYSIPLVARRMKNSDYPEDVERGIAVKNLKKPLEDLELVDLKETKSTHSAQVELRRINSKDSLVTFTEGYSGDEYSIECPICRFDLRPQDFPIVSTCDHRSCYNCFRQYLRIEISESRVNIACPECSKSMHPNDIRSILNDQVLFQKYENFMVRRVLANDPCTRWCPKADCCYGVIAVDCANCPKIKCERPGCDSYFCYHCRVEWHPNQTCDAARAQNLQNICSPSISFSHYQDNIKSCPRCHVPVIKTEDGSCNHMTCSVCGVEYCWLCMKETDPIHFLSPSGCTLWGKKPWSRKKKILWQIGTLTCAPVAIAILAGITAPSMIIGIPIWVGRKLYIRYKSAKRYKRNLIVTGGVLSSLLISPILTGLAIGIGAPILLFYAYGIMPISLWRSGNLGMPTTTVGTIFEFNGNDGQISVQTGHSSSGVYVNGSESLTDQFDKQNKRIFIDKIGLRGACITNNVPVGVLSANQKVEVQVHLASTKPFGTNNETPPEMSALLNSDITTTRAFIGCKPNLETNYSYAGTINHTNNKMAEIIPLNYDNKPFIVYYIITLLICVIIIYLHRI